ncbi:hypothetical protein, partial [Palleronia caenipelagi]
MTASPTARRQPLGEIGNTAGIFALTLAAGPDLPPDVTLTGPPHLVASYGALTLRLAPADLAPLALNRSYLYNLWHRTAAGPQLLYYGAVKIRDALPIPFPDTPYLTLAGEIVTLDGQPVIVTDA